MFPTVDSSAAALSRPKKRIRSSVNLIEPHVSHFQGTLYNPNLRVLLPEEYELQFQSRKRSRSHITTSYEDHYAFDFMHPAFPPLSLAPATIALPKPFVPGQSIPDDQGTTSSSVTSSTVSREGSPTPDDFAAIAAIVDNTNTNNASSAAIAKYPSMPSAVVGLVNTNTNNNINTVTKSVPSANTDTGMHECTQKGCHGLMFFTRSDLLAHNRLRHKGNKRYMCKYCPKSFGHSGHLNRHTESVHLQRRRHKCGLCGDSFFQASHLQSHINHVHKRRKPWECTECNLKLTTENGLRNHLKNLHKATPKHACVLCDNSFILKNDLSRHMRRCHPDPQRI